MVARSSNEHARHPIEDALDAERAKDPLDLEWCRLLLRRLEEEKPPRPLVADRPGGRSPQPVEDFQAAAEQLARDATSPLEDMPAVVVPKRVDLADGCRIAPVRVAEGYPHWRAPATVGQANPLRHDDGWHVRQGAGRVTGELFGGCLEVLDWLRGTSAWPVGDEWSGRLLFFEPSEEKPTPLQVERILRSFGVQGIFDRVTGVLVGRARDHSAEEKAALEAAIRGVVAEEFGRPDLPLVANLPFGHTDPQWVLPLGVQAERDVDAQTLRLIEPWLA